LDEFCGTVTFIGPDVEHRHPRSIQELLYIMPLCHPDGAVFWRRRTYATLPAVLMRPETAQVLRPAKSAGHQEDTAMDYIKS
jgi:hypothetical protein